MEIMNIAVYLCSLSRHSIRGFWDTWIGQAVDKWGRENKKTPNCSSHVQKMDVHAGAREKPIMDRTLHLDDKLRIGVGKALELVLVQIHDEEFICRRELYRHLGELLVEVAGVAAIFLKFWDTKGEEESSYLSLVGLQSWCGDMMIIEGVKQRGVGLMTFF